MTQFLGWDIFCKVRKNYLLFLEDFLFLEEDFFFAAFLFFFAIVFPAAARDFTW